MLTVPVDDRGYTLGHGLFETILFADGEFVWWEDHLDRLTRGCVALRLPAPDPADCLAMARAAWTDAGQPARAAVRLNWSAGSGGRGVDLPDPLLPRLSASAAAAPQVTTPATLATIQIRRNDRSPASRLKTLSYLDNVLARAQARDAGADEALMLNTADEVACAAVGNVFWLVGGELHTPALECGVLDGVTRRHVVQAALARGLAVQEVRAPIGALRERPMFLTNSLVGVRRVSRLDGWDCPSSDLVDELATALGLS